MHKEIGLFWDPFFEEILFYKLCNILCQLLEKCAFINFMTLFPSVYMIIFYTKILEVNLFAFA